MSRYSTRDLFAAAREDAPPADVRENVWHRIAASSAVSAAAVSSSKAPPALLSMKGAVGAVVGLAGASVVGYGVLMHVLSPAAVPSNHARVPATVATGPTAGARRADVAPRGRAEVEVAVDAPHSVTAAPPSARANAVDSASALAEEVRLVTEARHALLADEPTRALDSVRRARHLRTRALEPEALRLEARALRALGRADDALAVELELRSRFPDNALGR
jgi:hypothetical protein